MVPTSAITLTIETGQHCQMVNITARVQAVLRDQQHREGMVVLYVPHTTAGVTINEAADPDVVHDVLAKLERLIPHREEYYRHAEGNSDSHLKAMLVGSSVTLLVEHQQLVLGRWQGVFFCEFDGPRTRKVLVKLIRAT